MPHVEWHMSGGHGRPRQDIGQVDGAAWYTIAEDRLRFDVSRRDMVIRVSVAPERDLAADAGRRHPAETPDGPDDIGSEPTLKWFASFSKARAWAERDAHRALR
jgi:hypothetical protein